MGKIPQETIDEILRRADMVQIVGRYTQLRKNGSAWLGLCPFHSERTPSFRVNPERGAFHCFGCKEGGGLVNFLMKVESLGFVEVMHKLGQEVGVEIQVEDHDDPEEARRRRLLDLVERCAHYYHELLTRSPLGKDALAYLARRGLGRDVIEKFRLGWAPPSGNALLQRLEQSSYTPQEGELVGVLRERQGRHSDSLRARIVFPICDAQDRVIAFGGRVLDDSQPKYLNTPETPIYSKRRNLFGLNLHRQSISRQDRAVVVEGYLDVVSLAQVEMPLAVASLGTALTSEQAQLLRRYTRNVIMAYDADNAGQNATLKGLELFEEAGLRVRIAHLEAGEDPDSLARKHGKEGVEQMLDGAVSVVDYIIERSREKFDLSRPEGKEDFVKEVLPAISKLRDLTQRSTYVKRLNTLAGVREDVLLSRLQYRGQIAQAHRQRGRIEDLLPEVRLFRVCVTYPEYFQQVRTRFSPKQVVSERFQPLFEALWKVPVGERPLQLQDLSPYIEEPEASADLTELLMEPPKETTAEDVEKLVQSLLNSWDQLRHDQLRRWVHEVGTDLDPEDQRYQEYKQLQRRLKGPR